MKQIKTKRLLLNTLDNDELEKRITAETDEHMKAAYAQMLDGCIKDPDNQCWYTCWDIVMKEGERRVGSFCFMGPHADGEVEIGYGVDPDYRRKGYAFEALKGAIEWAFSQKDVYFLTAETEQGNQASQALLKKLGFKEYAQGEEGPRFEKEKPATSWTGIYMCFGLSLGLAFGNMYDNIGVCMCLGICFGMCIGTLIDAGNRKTMKALKEKRGTKADTPIE